MAEDRPGRGSLADTVAQRRIKVPTTIYAAVPGEEKDDSIKSATVRANWWRRIMLDSWAPEIIAITFSTVCIIAIAAVLLVYEGKTTPHLPYGITLNAATSILATASRSLLIFTVAAAIGQLKWCWYRCERGINDLQSFDDASRGPWGSVMLLFSRRTRSPAAVGAAITVLTLAFDPFVQQVLTYPTKMILAPTAAASALRATSFVTFRDADSFPEQVSDEWLNAISAGIWSNTTQLMSPPTCASGTCTWPEPVKSVGWCSKCMNAMPYAKLRQCDFAGEWWQLSNETLNSANGTKCIVDFGHGTNIQLLNAKEYIYYGDSWTPNPTLTQHAMWNLGGLALDYSTDSEARTINNEFLNLTNPVLTLGRVSVETSKDSESLVHITAAEECVLTLCERAFNISVVNATASFELLHIDYGTTIWLENTNDTTRDEYNSSYTCWQPGEAASHVLNYTSTPLNTREMCDYAGTETSYSCPSGLNWACQRPFKSSFASTLLDRLTGNITWQFDQESPDYNMDVTKWITTRNLSTVVDSVAASLTQLGLSANTTEQVLGQAWQREVHVSVAWVWLSLPAALTLGSILLLIAAAVQSKRYKVKLWKSSVLPLLYHGFEDGRLGSKMVPEDVSGMAEVAGGEKMQMVDSSMRRRRVLS
ncbi:hypothetical protein LTR17_004006 [Elasticomyces elasticus]|nr:hypothetical protein LTR17_004006 [Elasticomyces elasticus]